MTIDGKTVPPTRAEIRAYALAKIDDIVRNAGCAAQFIEPPRHDRRIPHGSRVGERRESEPRITAPHPIRLAPQLGECYH
jgi:hypothetical protein